MVWSLYYKSQNWWSYSVITIGGINRAKDQEVVSKSHSLQKVKKLLTDSSSQTKKMSKRKEKKAALDSALNDLLACCMCFEIFKHGYFNFYQ